MKRLEVMLSLVILLAACSAQQSAPTGAAKRGVCMEFRGNKMKLTDCCSHYCAGQLSACTERSGGDFSACARERTTCESTCIGDQAEERAEDGSRVMAPIDSPHIKPRVIHADVGTDAAPDSGQAVD